MPASITSKFRIHNSEQFVESFSETAPTTYYLGIGRPQEFGTLTRPDSRTDNQGTDSAPVFPIDSIVDEFDAYDDLLALKKLNGSDIIFTIPRINWVTGTVYDYYRHDYGRRITGTTNAQTGIGGTQNLFDTNFYVLTSANRIYKCLDNNDGAVSTVEPTSTGTQIQETADGYKWKYMYSLTATQIVNFLTTNFIPVNTDSTVSAAAVNGAVNIVKVKTVGTSGTNGTHTGIPIRGDGTGGEVTVEIASGAISSVTVTNAGSGYTYAYITLSDINANGGGALASAELDAIIEPKGGHGFNAVSELGGYFVMVNQTIEGSESSNSQDYTVDNNFRKLVLIRNPESGGSAATVTTLRATKAIRIASSPTPGTFQVDEEITQATTGATGLVVEWDAANRILFYIQPRFNNQGVDTNGDLVEFSGSNVITGTTSSATGTPDTADSGTTRQIAFTGGYADSEVDEDSGDVMFIENRAPIQRAADQSENIKLIIEF